MSLRDSKDSLETYYRIQREIRSTGTLARGPYCVERLEFENYQIPRTEIIQSFVGLNLLEKWLELDSGLSADKRRDHLVDRLRNSYYTEYSLLCRLAIQQGQPLEKCVHAWFFAKVRELEGIYLEQEWPAGVMNM